MTSKKTRKKKRKLKIKKFLLFLIILSFLGVLTFIILNINIKNIYISGNHNYSDTEILKKAKINDYPSFFMTSAILTEMKLKKDPLIKNASVKKKWWLTFEVKITEYKPYFRTTKKVLILESGITVDETKTPINLDAPVLVSDLKSSLFKSLVVAFGNVNEETIGKISEIEYNPSALDKERFLFLMADGNYAYVTLNNIENINYYCKIVTQLAGERGIIHFDSYRPNDAGITIDILK